MKHSYQSGTPLVSPLSHLLSRHASRLTTYLFPPRRLSRRHSCLDTSIVLPSLLSRLLSCLSAYFVSPPLLSRRLHCLPVAFASTSLSSRRSCLDGALVAARLLYLQRSRVAASLAAPAPSSRRRSLLSASLVSPWLSFHRVHRIELVFARIGLLSWCRLSNRPRRWIHLPAVVVDPLISAVHHMTPSLPPLTPIMSTEPSTLNPPAPFPCRR